MIWIKILIITGQQSFSTIEKIVKPIHKHNIDIHKAPISVSAFLSENMTAEILKSLSPSSYELVMLPGFVQWDTTDLEKKLLIKIKKGPEFASDLPMVLKNLEKISLSNSVPANKLLETTGEKLYEQIVKEQIEVSKKNLSQHTFYLKEKISEIIVGRNLPPPIIAEIVNCTQKSNKSILRKAKHYIDSGANIIDIGCVSNKPNPERIKEIIDILRKNFNVLISIDSMDTEEILVAVENQIDLILSLDIGNYKDFLNIPKDIPIVILPTNISEGYFPKDPETRIENLFKLTKILKEKGFKKLIADPLLETPIAPGICNSLDTYFLYRKKVSTEEFKDLELPLFFGISNVVELMDIDSIGVNGLLASIAIELDVGVLFTVEHSTKLTGGVSELKNSIKLTYISKNKKTPPINQGIQIFRAKGKTSVELPKIEEKNAITVDELNPEYISDEKGYFKIYVNHYSRKIYVLFLSNNHKILRTIIGNSAESLSKNIIELDLTSNLQHINYLGRELSKAEFCLLSGKPYIQDE